MTELLKKLARRAALLVVGGGSVIGAQQLPPDLVPKVIGASHNHADVAEIKRHLQEQWIVTCGPLLKEQHDNGN